MSLILSGTDGLSDVDGTAATPAIRGTDTNTGIFFPAADTVAASVGGTEGLRLTSTGLTIGGSTPRLLANMSGSPQSGRFAIQNSTTDGNTRFYLYPNGTGNISAINMWNNSDPSAANYSSVDIGIISTIDVRFSSQASGSASVLPMTWYMGASERMRLDSSGNLGLGVTPSAWPSTWRAFQVGGSSGHGGSIYTNAGGTTGQIGVGQNWFFNGSNNLYITSAAASDYYQFGGAHVWRIAPSGTAGNAISFTQVMTLDSSGNLSVGTTAIASSGQSNSLTTGAAVAVKGVLQNHTTAALILDYNSNRSTLRAYGATAGSGLICFNVGGGNNSADFEAARITSGGDLLVGTTSATAKVSIVPSSTDALALLRATVVGVRLTPSADVYMYDTNGNWTNTVRAGAFANMSDVRFKNVCGSLESVLGKLNSVETIRYTVKSGNDKEQIGFSAQNLKEVFPEFVIGVEDDIGYGINYAQFAAVLTKAIQEQQAIIESLTARITALEAK